MVSRFLSGLVVGTALSGVALGAISLAKGGVGRTTGPRPAVLEMPVESEFNRARDDTAARLPQTDIAPGIGGEVPLVDSATPDDLSGVAVEDTRPALRPTLGTIDGDLSAPQILDEASGMSVGGAEPVKGARALEAEGTAASDWSESGGTLDDPAISADPAQPSLPEIESGVGLSAKEDSSSDPSLPAPEPEMSETGTLEATD